MVPTAASPITLITPAAAGTAPGRGNSAETGAPGDFADVMRANTPAPSPRAGGAGEPQSRAGTGHDEGGNALPPEGGKAAADPDRSPVTDPERSPVTDEKTQNPQTGQQAGRADAGRPESTLPPQKAGEVAVAAGLETASDHAVSDVVDSLNQMLQHAAQGTQTPAVVATSVVDGEVAGDQAGAVMEGALPVVDPQAAAHAAMTAASTAHGPASQASSVAVAASGTAAAIATAPGRTGTGEKVRTDAPGQSVKLAVAEAIASRTSESQGGAGAALTGRSALAVSERGMTAEVLAQMSGNLTANKGKSESALQALAVAGQVQAATRRADPAALRAGESQAAILVDGARPASVTSSVQGSMVSDLPPLQAQSRTFDQLLGERIMMMVNQRVQNAEIRLSPAHLGSIEVRLSMNGEQANVQFLAASAATRETLETSMPRLREMFAEAGLELHDSDVRDQQSAAREEGDGNRDGWGMAAGEGEATDAELRMTRGALQARGLVDTYA